MESENSIPSVRHKKSIVKEQVVKSLELQVLSIELSLLGGWVNRGPSDTGGRKWTLVMGEVL